MFKFSTFSVITVRMSIVMLSAVCYSTVRLNMVMNSTVFDSSVTVCMPEFGAFVVCSIRLIMLRVSTIRITKLSIFGKVRVSLVRFYTLMLFTLE